jgi:hypothetical protein
MKLYRWISLLLIIFLASCNFNAKPPSPAISESGPIRTVEEFERAREETPEQFVVMPAGTLPDRPTITNGGPQAHLNGYTSELINWPLIGIHVTVLPDGRVFSFGSGLQGNWAEFRVGFFHDIWNPRTGAHLTRKNRVTTNIFCAGTQLDQTGKVVIIGGDIRTTDADPWLAGVKDVNAFNFSANTLQSALAMTKGRWYPTVFTLPNGNTYVMGGIDSLKNPVSEVEIRDYQTGAWTILSPNQHQWQWSYPPVFTAPNGLVISVAQNMYYHDTATDTYIHLRTRGSEAHDNGAAIIADVNGKYLISGGSTWAGASDGPAVRATTLVDITGPQLIVGPGPSMAYARKYHSMTQMADLQFLVSGGASTPLSSDEGKVMPMEIYNPVSNTFRTISDLRVGRMYHSNAVLLLDGRVLIVGGDYPTETANYNAEVYYPPYLWRKDGSGLLALRPSFMPYSPTDSYKVISVGYGGNFTGKLSLGTVAKRVTLVKFGNPTHAFNGEQRGISLTCSQTSLACKQKGDVLDVKIPTNRNMLTPGYYMAFIFNQNEVPSVAQVVNLK